MITQFNLPCRNITGSIESICMYVYNHIQKLSWEMDGEREGEGEREKWKKWKKRGDRSTLSFG